jgi:hypothetical protein
MIITKCQTAHVGFYNNALLQDCLNTCGKLFDLHQLMFRDISSMSLRYELLQWFAVQAHDFIRSNNAFKPCQVFSDYDDTIQAVWIDKRYPKGTVYPGAVAFLNEMHASMHQPTGSNYTALGSDASVNRFRAPSAPLLPAWWDVFLFGSDIPFHNASVRHDQVDSVRIDDVDAKGEGSDSESEVHVPGAEVDGKQKPHKSHRHLLRRALHHVAQFIPPVTRRHAHAALETPPTENETFSSSRASFRQCVPSSLVVITARPADYRGLLKKRTLERLATLRLGHVIALMGSLLKSTSTTAIGTNLVYVYFASLRNTCI